MQISGFSKTFSAPKANAAVSPDLAGEVKKELGDSVLPGLATEKIDTLQRYFFGGEEFVSFDAAKSLGKGWKEIETDCEFATKEFELRPDPNGDFQRLTMDTRDNSIHLATGNAEPGPFEGTLDIENIWLTADGSVKRNRGTCV
ncbi:hypothetical protein JST97_15200 [bacterium]|nr:hypothetical protein [bacterium]